jgi:hypothetical protein
VEEGKAWGSLKLEGFEKKVEVNGKTYVVKVIGGEAVEEDRGGRKLLRIKIKAEVSRVEGEHIVDPWCVNTQSPTAGAEPTTRPRASPMPAPTRQEAGRQTPRGSSPW